MDNRKTASGKPLFFVASVLTAAYVAYVIGSHSPSNINLTQIVPGSLIIGLVCGFVIAVGVAWFVISEKHHEQLLAEAVIDPESGLYTRHYMNEIAPRFVALHQRNPDAGFAVSLFKIDDSAIPAAFDAATRRQAFANLATVIMETIRETDMAVQFSPEQVAVFSNCDSEQVAEQTLQRILERVGQIRVATGQRQSLELPVKSAQVIHGQKETLGELIARVESLSFAS